METEFQACDLDTPKTETTTTSKTDITTLPSQAVFVDGSDFEIADQFVLTQSRNWRYVDKTKRWFFWDGSRWMVSEKLGHMTAINKLVSDASIQLQKETLKSGSKSHAVCQVAKAHQEIAAHPDDFDANQWLLGCKGETVNLRTGARTTPHPDDMITKSCLATPDDSGCPNWLQFLSEVINGDADVISFLQRLCGYMLTGSTKEQKLFFFYGTGKNGKGTFLNTIQGIMGDYARTASAKIFLESNQGEHATGLAGLSGARLVVSSELPANKPWNEPVIKDMTSSDTLTARFMRGDFFDFKPTHKLFIQGNHQPTFRSVDEAITRRVVLVPFTMTIPADKVDPDLEEKLKEEWNGILSWMIDGCLEWQTNGLQIPEAVSKASSEYMEAEDSVGMFLEECTTNEGEVSSAELFKQFHSWQKDSGVSNTWTQKAMTQAIKERGYKQFRRTSIRGFKGLSLKKLNYYPEKFTDEM